MTYEVDIREDKSAKKEVDYDIDYEISFNPRSLSKGSLDVYITSLGNVGIGVERWSRIASRLGFLSWRGARYVAGFEPRNLTDDEVIHICNLIYSGMFQIHSYHMLKLIVGSVITDQHRTFPARSFGIPSSLRSLQLLTKIGVLRETLLTYVGWAAQD
jgi:hypothetical protein